MTPFPFQSISTGMPVSAHEPASLHFAPLAIFDTSETGGTRPTEPEPEQEGIFITEEDLDKRLRESFTNGLTEGKNLAERGLFNVFKALRTSSEQVTALREKVLRDSEDELLTLVMKISRKVILREISLNRNILAGIVHTAVSGLPDNDEITVRLNPDDMALINSGHSDMLHTDHAGSKMTLKADPSIMIGSCKVDMSMGVIDATVDSQLDEIFRYMKEERTVTAGES